MMQATKNIIARGIKNMSHLESNINKKLFIGVVVALTLWLFSCVCWITLTNHAQLAKDARYAAGELLGEDGGNIVQKSSHAVAVINAVAVAESGD